MNLFFPLLAIREQDMNKMRQCMCMCMCVCVCVCVSRWRWGARVAVVVGLGGAGGRMDSGAGLPEAVSQVALRQGARLVENKTAHLTSTASMSSTAASWLRTDADCGREGGTGVMRGAEPCRSWRE